MVLKISANGLARLAASKTLAPLVGEDEGPPVVPVDDPEPSVVPAAVVEAAAEEVALRVARLKVAFLVIGIPVLPAPLAPVPIAPVPRGTVVVVAFLGGNEGLAVAFVVAMAVWIGEELAATVVTEPVVSAAEPVPPLTLNWPE